MITNDQPIAGLGAGTKGHYLWCHEACKRQTTHYQAPGSSVAVCLCGGAQHRCHGCAAAWTPTDRALCAGCDAVESRR